MAMTAELWEELSGKILEAGGDQAVLTTVLNQARNEFAELLADHTSKTEENQKLTARVDQLLDANREFYLQLGEYKKQEGKKDSEDKKQDPEKVTPEDLMKSFFESEEK